MPLIDRILTIVVTATITSLVWIVAGGSLIENATADSQKNTTRPADAAPSPTATGSDKRLAGPEASNAGPDGQAPKLDRAEADARGNLEADEGDLVIPVLNVRPSDLTDTFTDSRGGGTRLHEALDIMAPTGTTVRAAAPGTVEKLFQSKAGGNTIYVRSSDRETIYYYAHLDRYAQGLREGQSIRRGQRLGTVGSTGNAEADTPHLHFAILQTTESADWWEPATARNPYVMLAGNE